MAQAMGPRVFIHSLRVGAEVGWADVVECFSGPTHCTRRVQRRASGTECQVEVIITPVPRAQVEPFNERPPKWCCSLKSVVRLAAITEQGLL